MSKDNLKDFTTSFVVGGLLMFCLLAFTITFMYNNNPTGLGSTGDKLNGSYNDIQNELIVVEEGSNSVLNITSNTNPEVSDLGSRDSVATSFQAYGTSKSMFETSRDLIAWVFTGTSGKIILSVIGGLVGLVGFFLITKNFRQGY